MLWSKKSFKVYERKITAILLTEYNNLQVEQSGKSLYLKGIVASADTANKNSRVYPNSVLSSAMHEMQDKIRNKECYGECGHSQNGNVDYWRVSHMFESIHRRGNDWYGKAKILDTPGGNILKAIVRESGACGFSTKGMGSVKKLPNGLHEVQSDYRCTSIDCVPSPSNPKSYIKAISEGVENNIFNITENQLVYDILKKLGHDLDSQQKRMNYDPSSVLYPGHSGFSNLPDDSRSHYERLLQDTLDMIEKLANLQVRMRNTDGSAQDNQGFSTDTRHLNFSYADAIRDPIKRAQVKQPLWNARTNEIMRNRAVQQLARIGKFNKS